MDSLFLLLQWVTTGMMCGLTWFVQIAHYPGMRDIPADAFAGMEQQYTRRAGMVIPPIMLTELGGAIGWLWESMGTPLQAASWWGLGLLVAIWLSTFCIQVPLHRKLSRGKSAEDIHRLVTTNWIRTLGWTGRLGILASVSHGGLPA